MVPFAPGLEFFALIRVEEFGSQDVGWFGNGKPVGRYVEVQESVIVDVSGCEGGSPVGQGCVEKGRAFDESSVLVPVVLPTFQAAAQEEILVSVVVEISKESRVAHSIDVQSEIRSNILEGSVAPVAPELVPPPPGSHVEVVPAIPVDINHCHRGVLIERVPRENVDPVVLRVREGRAPGEEHFPEVAFVN